MYPLNMNNGVGFALANDEDEHKALTAQGYQPAWKAPEKTEIDVVKEKLDAAGITYDKRLGLDKLKALLPQE